ncbi:MAG: class I SAM-dependent methyltransferase [Paracoccaceae bacterium]
MGFFDFLGDDPAYAEKPADIARLNRRWEFLIAPFGAELEGARVADIAAHDGRWAYALAGAGAAEVIGVEARCEVAARFARYPRRGFKRRVRIETGDLYRWLSDRGDAGETFDIVALFGIFYHVMDHFRLLADVRRLRPKLIIIDSEFILADNPMIQLVKERTDNILNAAPQIEGQEMALKGIPSRAAMERMAEALGYDLEWLDWSALALEDRAGVQDYFREGRMRRGTCALRPARSP